MLLLIRAQCKAPLNHPGNAMVVSDWLVYICFPSCHPHPVSSLIALIAPPHLCPLKRPNHHQYVPTSEFGFKLTVPFPSLVPFPYEFLGKGLVQTLGAKTSLTKDQAAARAKQYIADSLPELSSRIELIEVCQRMCGTNLNTGTAASWANGYLVRFAVVSDRIPVWDAYVSVTFRADQIEGVSFRYYDEEMKTAPATQNASSREPKGARALKKLCRDSKSSSRSMRDTR